MWLARQDAEWQRVSALMTLISGMFSKKARRNPDDMNPFSKFREKAKSAPKKGRMRVGAENIEMLGAYLKK